MPTRLCLEPRCPRPARPGSRRCAEHATEHRRYQRSVNDSFYSSKAWRISRSRFLFDHPLCERCGTIAEHVHHRQPLTEGGAPRDPANLEALCAACHTATHRQMRRQGP